MRRGLACAVFQKRSENRTFFCKTSRAEDVLRLKKHTWMTWRDEVRVCTWSRTKTKIATSVWVVKPLTAKSIISTMINRREYTATTPHTANKYLQHEQTEASPRGSRMGYIFFLCFILNKRICRLWIDIAQEESKEDFILTTETDKPFNREGEMPHLNHEWGITIDDLDPVQVPTLKGSSENQRITYNADRGGSGIKRLTWTQTRSWTWWS